MTQCVGRVWGEYRDRRCLLPAKRGSDYCGKHGPDGEARRAEEARLRLAASRAEVDTRISAMQELRRKVDAYPQLVDLVRKIAKGDRGRTAAAFLLRSIGEEI